MTSVTATEARKLLYALIDEVGHWRYDGSHGDNPSASTNLTKT
jgi:hypothetical protein